ncbi:DUF1456 family protein [Pseudomonas sp. NPDC007930]|uniref:DUF1456 family protein n=1 Tax=Pseudomonas sp. NPDC007930 TaxID=3364417 RepID=UPI0036EB6A83
MIHNDVLRSVRYMLNISDGKLVDIIRLGGHEVAVAEVALYLKKEEEAGYLRCPDRVMAHFLDGLVFHKRGKDDSRPPLPIVLPVNNNDVLKKLRVAFELKEDDVRQVLDSVGFAVSKPELSALFRKEGHNNFRPCGDQLLRNFLKGLTQRVRP